MTTNASKLLENYVFHRASAFINYSESNKDKLQAQEIGRVFYEYEDKLIVIVGENQKEHEYLIPKTKVHRYGDNQVYFNVSKQLDRI
jgi:hypothetical protein